MVVVVQALGEDEMPSACGIVLETEDITGSTTATSDDEDGDATSEPESDSSTEPDEEILGTSELQTIFNIVKNIVGEGMLSLSAGVAAGTGVITGAIIVFLFGGFLGYTFNVMGRVCHATGKNSHKECAKVVGGPILARGMAGVCMLKTASTCISYAIVVSQSVPRILAYLDVAGWYTERQIVLISVVVLVLLPLCLQRDLSCLSYTSLIGIICEVSVIVFMQIRLLDGSYQPGGTFYDSNEPADRPHGDRLKWPVTISTFILVSSVLTAFIAHYNAPKFYLKMANPSPEKWLRVVTVSFVISSGLYVWVMVVGYLTFRQSCQGLILNNYSDKDKFAAAARALMCVAVVFAFPLAFTGLRDSVLAVVGLRDRRRTFAAITIAILAAITSIACVVTDLGLLNSFGGAVFGSLITMIFPALLILLTAKKLPETKVFGRVEARMSWVVLGLGLVFMCLGCFVVVCNTYYPGVLRPHGSRRT
mmetsp:Transcript_52681/g.138993  ORF Transcript_52681/g.138993 Transcript_52681/m.138993 type:complete len:478 (-) Transcript_52681:23-1456(-)